MMLSESWCFEQKVQEKGDMERKKHSFPWSSFCTVGKKKNQQTDVPVVSFNLVRPAGVLIYAVCSFCCYSPNRQLGYLGWIVCPHRGLHCCVFAGKWVLNESCS